MKMEILESLYVRRWLVLFGVLALLAIAGCGGEREEDDDMGRIAPWHMWGTSTTLTLPNLTPLTGPLFTASAQLVQVNYARPETWSFICEAKLLSADGGSPPPAGTLTLDYELQLGVGRSTIILPNFCEFKWDPSTDVGVQRYSTVVPGPLRFAGDTNPNLITDFSAQSIQAAARVSWASAGVSTAQLEISMHVAPKAHIRPEWYRQGAPDQQFPGEENKGK